MHKRQLCIIMVLVLLVSILGLAACGSKNAVNTENVKTDATAGADGGTAETAKAQTPATDEKVTLRVLTRFSDDTPISKSWQDRLNEFKKSNPNITIEDESVMNEDSFNSKFKTAVASSNLQDLFTNYGGSSIGEYVKNGLFLDMDPIIAGDKEWSDAFMPIFDNWQIKGVKGTYGIPSEFYAVGIYYNKDLFKAENIEPPKTVKEFLAVSEKFKAKGIIPMALGDKDVWRAGHLMNNLVMKKFGFPKIQDLADRKAKYDDSDMIEIFKMMSDWNKNEIFGKNIVSVDYAAEKALFFNEKSAMHMDGSWFLGDAAASKIADKIGFVPFPYFDDKAENKDNWMGGAAGGYSISANLTEANKAASIKLLKYLTSVEHFKYVQKVMKGGVYPVKFEADASVVSPLTLDFVKAISTAKDMKTDIPTYDTLTQLMDRVRNSVAGMFAGNSPEKAAKEIQDEIVKGSK